tara:strand:+ start:267 stop:437 length:171 start_codon:yes stop_codon:yes gene_type:complete
MRYHDPLSFNILISDATDTTFRIYSNSEYLTPDQFEADIVVVGQGDNHTFEEVDDD